MKRKAHLAVVVAAAAVVVSAIAVSQVSTVLQSARAKTTATRMRAISAVLQAKRVERLPLEGIEAYLSKEGLGGYERDGWGYLIDVAVEVDAAGVPHYRIRSLGRDGVPGSCCQRFIGKEWDLDGVLLDDEWLQSWF